jgi:anti-anti-sigma factor
MSIRSRTVMVEHLPEIRSMKQARRMLRNLTSAMGTECPRIVLDCTHVLQVDRPLLRLLVACLEEALKRSGDVKLAAVQPATRAILQLTGVERLFEIYKTSADAVSSFLRLPPGGVPARPTSVRSPDEQSAA